MTPVGDPPVVRILAPVALLVLAIVTPLIVAIETSVPELDVRGDVRATERHTELAATMRSGPAPVLAPRAAPPAVRTTETDRVLDDPWQPAGTADAAPESTSPSPGTPTTHLPALPLVRAWPAEGGTLETVDGWRGDRQLDRLVVCYDLSDLAPDGETWPVALESGYPSPESGDPGPRRAWWRALASRLFAAVGESRWPRDSTLLAWFESSGSLYVQQDEEGIRAVEATLDRIGRSQSVVIPVRFDLHDATSGDHIESHVVEVVGAGAGRAHRGSIWPFVADYDVEISMGGSSLTGPLIDGVETGFGAVACWDASGAVARVRVEAAVAYDPPSFERETVIFNSARALPLETPRLAAYRARAWIALESGAGTELDLGPDRRCRVTIGSVRAVDYRPCWISVVDGPRPDEEGAPASVRVSIRGQRSGDLIDAERVPILEGNCKLVARLDRPGDDAIRVHPEAEECDGCVFVPASGARVRMRLSGPHERALRTEVHIGVRAGPERECTAPVFCWVKDAPPRWVRFVLPASRWTRVDRCVALRPGHLALIEVTADLGHGEEAVTIALWLDEHTNGEER